jgi:prepilin-type N-terminal cleavage/methylation domain-containing protein
MRISHRHDRTGARKGFTLIELLVVIAIIGILSSVVLASLNSARKKGRDARRVADIKQLQLALELAYDASGSYPSGDGAASTTLADLVSDGYIAAMPTDPGSGSYGYVQTDSGSGYVIGAILETTNTALNTDYDGAQAITINGGSTNCNTNAGTPGTGETVYCVSQ